METTARPRRSVLWAVIEEARKRARRRRVRFVVLALIAAAGCVVAFANLKGGSTSSSGAEQGIRFETAVIASLPKNGKLTLMAVHANAQHEGPLGWYGISSFDPRAGLRTVVRCPHRVRWCGELESIDWASDGARLAFGVTSFGMNNPYNGLHVFNVRTGGDRELVHQGEHGEHDWFDIDWAPDGRRLAYATDGHIAVVNADGSGRRVLETGTVGHDHSPSWSPSGRWIAFASRLDGVSAVYAVRADGSGRQLLARAGAAPAWSPNGSRIAFRSSGGVEFVSPKGTLLAARPPFRAGVPAGIDAPPVWSPDGREIAMSSRRDGTWVMNADGTGLRRVTRYASDGIGISQMPRPAWRPRP